jgi:hypothetical protein
MTNYPRALDQFEQWEITQGLAPSLAKQRYDGFREILSNGGERDYWLKRLEIAKANTSSSPYAYAEIYARLGDKGQALDWLETAFAKHDSMDCLLADEFWDDFRQEPRFVALLEAAGLTKVMLARRE